MGFFKKMNICLQEMADMDMDRAAQAVELQEMIAAMAYFEYAAQCEHQKAKELESMPVEMEIIIEMN